MKLTVYFEGEFWVGVTEHEADGKVKASRYVFGSEPYDAEVMEFVQFRMLPLLAQTSVGVSVDTVARRGRVNPKRLAREAAREMERKGVRSAAQEALRLELEHRKKTRKIVSREQREAEKERKREIAIQKAKAKHRGR
ncbi:YjdF family protein [Paenibacillus ehimensis]|uniref:YjdF family protein n=1 Tax=Paenibacillus ehimensis TaxID=79264 RepID=UPI000FDBD219|nr:YjdF family protein [Paenibacillus ehimensis]